MSRASATAAVLVADEASWGEDSSSYDLRLAVRGEVNAETAWQQTKIDSERTTQLLSDYTHPIRGPHSGSFTTPIWLPGHGAAITGAATADDHENVLGYVIGNTNASTSGTTVNGSSTTTSLAVAAASGIPAGSLITVGVKGDGRGDGQAAVVSSHGSSTIALLTALPAAPESGDVVYAMVVNHPWETPSSAAITSVRMAALSANRVSEMRGCWPRSLTFEGLNPGELPGASIEWGVSYPVDSTETFPSSTAMDTHNPAPCAGGSLFFQARGTTTRQTYDIREFGVTIGLGTQEKRGPGGLNTFQDIIGAVRGKQTVTATFVVDTGNASASPTWPGRWDSDSQDYHLLWTGNGAAAGQRLAFYMPNCCIVDRRPSQFSRSGINSERITVMGKTGLTTTSELTLSAWRLGSG